MNVFLAAVLVLIYAAQLPSPLRINTDAITVLQLTGQLTDHQPYLTDGGKPLFPIGVPFTFSAMERAGVAGPTGFAVFNLLCILAAATAAWTIYRRNTISTAAATGIGVCAFSNFVLFKHSVIPLTDIPYTAVSLGCVACLEAAESQRNSRRYGALIFALVLCAASILSRRVGVALVPAVLFSFRPSAETFGRVKRSTSPLARRAAFGAIVVLLVAAVAVGVARVLHLPDFRARFAASGVHMFTDTLKMRLVDFGEICVNAPASQLGRLSVLVCLVGIVPFALVVVRLFQDRSRPRPVDFYLAAYVAIMLVWPFADARFWLPVLPLLAMFVWRGVQPLLKLTAARWIGAAYLIVYFLAALVAATFTTRLTFAGPRFWDLYGAGYFKSAYVVAVSGQPAPIEPAAAVIRRYGNLHRQAAELPATSATTTR